MKVAEYTLEFHDRSGPCRFVPFTGTRREARAAGKRLANKDDGGKQLEGVAIRFKRYVEGVAK